MKWIFLKFELNNSFANSTINFVAILCWIASASACSSGAAHWSNHPAISASATSEIVQPPRGAKPSSVLDDFAGADTPSAASDIPSSNQSDYPLLGAEKSRLPITAESSSKAKLQQSISLSALSLPLKEVFMALADQAGLELMLGNRLGSRDYLSKDFRLTLSLQARSLAEVLDRIAEQAGLAWHVKDSVLSVFHDRPYLHTYEVDYLNLDRTTQSSVGLATQVGSITLGLDGGASSGSSNNSSTHIENSSSHKFWDRLEIDLHLLTSVARDSSMSSEASASGISSSGLSINREAGLVMIRASQAIHRDVRVFLTKLQQSVNRQVLIEATVVEVALTSEHRAGIDWQLLSQGNGFSAGQAFHGKAVKDAASGNAIPSSRPSALVSYVSRSNTVGEISATLDLLNQFGDVRILSQPQIITLNNQSAVLKVVDNRVYFSVDVDRKNADAGEDVITRTRIHTVPVGLVMSVTPFISSRGHIVMNIRPTISRILGFINDPNPELDQTGIQNGVPEIQVREMESVLRLNDGEMAVIGGLMQQSSRDAESSVPFLSTIPAVGRLFRQNNERTDKTELLVFLRPVIMS